jgi:zinc protease
MSVPAACCGPLLPGLAEPGRERLANGVELVSLPLPEAPLVCIDFWCRAGSVFEAPGESGMAHFLEHMVFKGSRGSGSGQGLAAGEFDRRVEALGGSSNAATGFDDVHYHVLIPPAAAPEALDLLLELVLRPRLEAEAFAMERQVVLEELAQSEDQPEEVAVQRLLALACPDHPYGRPILGRREALLAQDPEAMEAFHHRLYAAGSCVLALSGAVADGELAARAANGPLAALPLPTDLSTDLPLPPLPTPPPPLALRPGEHHLALPRLEAARLLMAWWQPPADDLPGLMGADLATTVLAEGRRSRLVERLREQLRLVESIDLDLHAMETGSLALLEAVCESDELPAVRQAVTTVWQEVMAAPLPEAEWQRAQRLVANGYRFGLESAGGVAGLIGNNHLWGRRQGLEAPLQLLESWNPVDLRERALALLDPQRACVLEVVPA